MNRDERIKAVQDAFSECAEDFCVRTGGELEINDAYKGEERPLNLKYRYAEIVYNSFSVVFRYVAHAPLGVVHSIVECHVRLGKQEETHAVPLPFLIDFLSLSESAPLYIPTVSNKEGMQQAFDCIGGVIEPLLPMLAEISLDKERRDEVYRYLFSELDFVFNAKDYSFADGLPVFEDTVYDYLTLRFCSAPFLNYLKGDNEAAIKFLKKEKRPLRYERRMLSLWQTESADTESLSEIIKNAEGYGKSGAPKPNFKEFFALFISWFLLTIPISLVYIGIFLLFIFLQSRDSVYLMGAMYNLPFCICAGFITAISASYFFRFKIYKLIYRKDYETQLETDIIQNGGKEDRLMKGFTYILALLSLVASILFSNYNINFQSGGFIDNTKFLSVRGRYYLYSEIEKVYYRPDRVNGFGETLPYPSFVMKLRDGREIDFYDFDEIENYEKVLNHLKEKGVSVEKPE